MGVEGKIKLVRETQEVSARYSNRVNTRQM